MRPFFIVWTGQALSLLGSQLVQFALVWWLTTSTGSATVLALATLVSLLPPVLIGPFAGALVDRWPRRTVMIVADSGIALATLLLAVLYALDVAQVGHIYALLMVRALGTAFHWPAMQASTTLMVPEQHLGRVGGLNQTLTGLSTIFIPPLGALALQILPMQGILAIDVITALLAIAALLMVAIPQPMRRAGSGARPSVLADLHEGLRFVWGWKGLLLFAGIGTLIHLMGYPASALAPLLITEHLGGGAIELGLFQSAAGVGAVLGGLTLSVWGGSRRRMAVAILALAVDGLLITLIGLSPRGALALVVGLVFVVGLLETLVFGLSGAIFQSIVPPEIQGRVFALVFSIGQLAAPLGLAVAGPVADAVGVPFWWLLTGVTITGVSVATLCVPSVMQIETRARPALT